MYVFQPFNQLVVLSLQFGKLESLHVAVVAVLTFQQLLDLDCPLLQRPTFSTSIVNVDYVLAMGLEVPAHIENLADPCVGQRAPLHYITSRAIASIITLSLS